MSGFLSTEDLPEDYRDLKATVADFARTVVAPVAAQHDRDHTFPYDVVKGMADMGAMEMPLSPMTM